MSMINEQRQRQAVVDEAKSWIRTPYHNRAKVKGAGVDCGQILIAVYSTALPGIIPNFDPGVYNKDFMLHRNEEIYLGWIEKFAHKIKNNQLPGDVALFKFGRVVCHGAIIIDKTSIIHAYSEARCVVIDDIIRNVSLANHFYGFYRPNVWGE